MERKLIAFAVASALFGAAVFATVALYRGRPRKELPDERDMRIYSTRSEQVPSFFDGLPVDERFTDGKNPFASSPQQGSPGRSPASTFGTWIKGLLGTTVYAVTICDSCFGSTQKIGCGTYLHAAHCAV